MYQNRNRRWTEARCRLEARRQSGKTEHTNMTKQLTLGTARITQQPNYTLLEFIGTGSWLLGERVCESLTEAQEFCRERRIRVIEVSR